MRLFCIILLITSLLSACNTNESTYAVIATDYGNMRVKLYNSTPQHRDNFVKLVKESYYDSLLFHRVMSNFMIQGGDPNSKNAPPNMTLGNGGPGYTIPAEIGAPHFKGALSAARRPDGVNPQRASSGSQFFIVQGTPQTDAMLDNITQAKGITYSETQRNLYKEIGGYPFLDNDYTVFGEVVEGLEVIDKIAAVQTANGNRPVQDVRINSIRLD
ncbi:MAG: peptidylprolyl isomerase [Bacteroidota bacterium]